jgi:hypothetical protein
MHLIFEILILKLLSLMVLTKLIEVIKIKVSIFQSNPIARISRKKKKQTRMCLT